MRSQTSPWPYGLHGTTTDDMKWIGNLIAKAPAAAFDALATGAGNLLATGAVPPTEPTPLPTGATTTATTPTPTMPVPVRRSSLRTAA